MYISKTIPQIEIPRLKLVKTLYFCDFFLSIYQKALRKVIATNRK